MSLCAIKNNLVKSSQTVYIYISVPCHFNVSTWWRPIFLHFYWPEKLKRTFFFSFGNAFIVTTAYIYMVWRWVKSRNEMIYSISLVCSVWFSFRSDCIHRVHTECRWWPRAKGAPLKTFDSSDSWHSLSLSFFFLTAMSAYLCVNTCLWVGGHWLDLLNFSSAYGTNLIFFGVQQHEHASHLPSRAEFLASSYILGICGKVSWGI